jgi:hypothetical protein
MPGEATIARLLEKEAARLAQKEAERLAEKEVGKGLVKLAAKKAASRILGKLAVNSKAWGKAFVHIAEHFGPVEGKASHAIFTESLRSKTAIEKLLRQALTKLGRAPVVGKLTISGVPAGKPCVILEKEFAEVIGKIEDKPCKILRIVVDYTGKPITAYPVEKFFGAAAIATGVLLTPSTSEADVPRVAAVEDAYAAEQQAFEERMQRANERADGPWYVQVFDVLTFDSSPVSVDPQEASSPGEVTARANAAVQRIESSVGSLDGETEENIRKDVRRIWGYYVPDD